MDTKELQQEFISWCKSKKKSPKTEEETKQLFHAFMKEKHPKEYEAAMKQQNQTQKAARGAKLQYIKNLKHQCADDEELYYYKKGGSVDCGCKKKEDGGEVKIAQKGTVVQKFKNRKQDQATKDSIAANVYNDQEVQTSKPGSYKKNKQGKVQWTPDRTKAPYNKTSKKEKGGEIKKDFGGSTIAKFKATRCGSKMKKK